MSSLSELTKNAKESEVARDVQTALKDNIHNISKLHQCLNKGVLTIDDKTTELKNEVSVLRKAIDDQLDKLENSIKDEIDSLGSQLKNKAVKDLEKIDNKKNAISLLQKEFHL